MGVYRRLMGEMSLVCGLAVMLSTEDITVATFGLAMLIFGVIVRFYWPFKWLN